MTSKVQNFHQELVAYIYLRQSSMSQVLHNRESTERQYLLKDKALAMGWQPQNIKILDGDLGKSGTQTGNRNDFKLLVAEVSMGKVGAIFVLEASRLSRSTSDWNRLTEICSLTNTLLIDEDGCYDPTDFNDQLLLGLKGTMSAAELHFMRIRLHQGKLNKAKKGQLRFPLPVGYCYDADNQIVLDNDQQVCHVIELLFSTFRETGSAYGVVRQFHKNNITFPTRSYGGAWNGKLIWGKLTNERACTVLKNPCYTGTYTYGRYKSIKIIGKEGGVTTKLKKQPKNAWITTINDHHPAYISWETYEMNLKMLEKNQTNGAENMLQTSAREGLSLLQGLLICGVCARRITVRYQGNGGIYPTYQCNGLKNKGISSNSCLSFRCGAVDQAVSERVFEVLKPENLKIALKALSEIENRSEAINKQWTMTIQRSEYEVNIAQRRYEEVDPANRLVAATLERKWNEALEKLEQNKQQFEAMKAKDNIHITPERKKEIRSLSDDIPKLWNCPSTSFKDKKRILRMLIEDITVKKDAEKREIILQLRWKGGACEEIPVKLPQKISDLIRYNTQMVDKVRQLSQKHPDNEIANMFNAQGYQSATKKPFTKAMISWIRYKHKIVQFSGDDSSVLTVKQVQDKFGVSNHQVYYWIENGFVSAQKSPSSKWLIRMDTDKEIELNQIITSSYKLKNKL